MTDAHCHPTDLDITREEYDEVKLGGIGAMATVPEDRVKVLNLGRERGWSVEESEGCSRRRGARVVSCFGTYQVIMGDDIKLMLGCRISPMVHSSIFTS